MLVGIDTFRSVVEVEIVFFQLIQHSLVNRHAMEAHHQPLRDRPTLIIAVSTPLMRKYLLYAVSFFGIDTEYIGNQVPELFRQPIRERIRPRKDLLIQIGCVGILKGQIPTDHGKQNHSTAPYIHVQSIVLLIGNHFGGCVAGRATRSF